MKRNVLLIAIAWLSLVGGGKPAPVQETTGAPASVGIELATPSVLQYDDKDVSANNPWLQFDNASDAAMAAGFTLRLNSTEGAPVKYHVLPGCLIEGKYQFENMDITVRRGYGSKDVSGDTNSYESVGTVEYDGIPVEISKIGDYVHCIKWTYDNFSYAILSSSGMDNNYANTLILDFIS